MAFELERRGLGEEMIVRTGLLQSRPNEGMSSTCDLFLTFDETSGRDDQPHVPPTTPYELSQLAADLVLLARYLLKPHGRLVFFLPTVTEDYRELDVQTFICDGMEVTANSLQDFGSWGRRVSRPLNSPVLVADFFIAYNCVQERKYRLPPARIKSRIERF
jgi:hypothetical protein